jgi:two-component system, NtrC family, response regulator AtoC
MKYETPVSHAFDRWLRQVGVGHGFLKLAAHCQSAKPGFGGFFIVDSDRTVLYWDPALEALLGFSAEDMVGSHCRKGNRCASCNKGCGLAEYGEVQDVALVLHHKNGAEVSLRKSGQAFFDEHGSFLGTIEFLRDANVVSESEGSVSLEEKTPSPRRWPGRSFVAFHGMSSADSRMREIFGVVQSAAKTDSPVLARGESGTGKELLALAVHAESERMDAPLVTVNCAAFGPALLESRLFGHVKGAVEGATSDQIGAFEQASGGTLFLDEIAELPLALQAKLLRTLERNEISPIGSTESVPIDVRLIAATQRSLRQLVQEGKFRADLMYRLRVVPLFLPPLRERRGDIEILLWHFIDQQNDLEGRVVNGVHPDAMRQLLDYDWPGNVRELENVVRYAFAVGRGGEIRSNEMPPELRVESFAAAPVVALSGEALVMQKALKQSGGNIGEAAGRLGMSRPTFWRKRKKYGL